MANIQIERRPSETAIDYHKRLIYGKLVDKTLSDIDYSELSEAIYNKQLSSDSTRKMMYGSLATLELLDTNNAAYTGVTMSGMDEKIMELQKERQKYFDQRTALTKMLRERARQEELNEIIMDTVATGNLPVLQYTGGSTEHSDNDLLVSLNDIHYGACFDNYWGAYNSDVCKSMMEKYIMRIIEIAETHKSENCIIWENGDAISGSIHRSIQVTNKENVIQQVVGVSELIAQFISKLSPHFKTVRFVSVSGNHSRVENNKDNALIEERLDDLIEWYLSARLQNYENVVIGGGRIDPTMYLINIRGLNYCGVHGDFDGSAFKVQSLQTMVGAPIYAVLSGHMHHNMVNDVQGVRTVMAGSFLGIDEYCAQKRIYGRPEQMVCVCNGSGILCYYDIPLR